jgi:hypothetical protein
MRPEPREGSAPRRSCRPAWCRTGPTLPDREGVVVLAPGCEKTGQLGLKPVVLVLEAVGVGAELPQAANDLVEKGAEHGRSITGTEQERKSLSTNPAEGYACRKTRFVSASPHEEQRKTCNSEMTPRLGTLRMSFITWPQPAQTVKGRLSAKAAITVIKPLCAAKCCEGRVLTKSCGIVSFLTSQGLRPDVSTKQYRNRLPPKKVRSRSPPHPPDDPLVIGTALPPVPRRVTASTPGTKGFSGSKYWQLLKC